MKKIKLNIDLHYLADRIYEDCEAVAVMNITDELYDTLVSDSDEYISSMGNYELISLELTDLTKAYFKSIKIDQKAVLKEVKKDYFGNNEDQLLDDLGEEFYAKSHGYGLV